VAQLNSASDYGSEGNHVGLNDLHGFLIF